MFFLGWFACQQVEVTPACTNDAQCERRCVDGSCILADCLSSVDCNLHEYCLDGDCIAGCAEQSDCIAGEDCIENECQPSGCQDTHLDCGYGEHCQQGECVVSSFPMCQPCGYEDWQSTPNGVQECILANFTPLDECFETDSDSCPADSSCYPADGVGAVDEGLCLLSYWFEPCQQDSDCPRPFICKRDVYQDSSEVNVCWADCPFWREQGVF